MMFIVTRTSWCGYYTKGEPPCENCIQVGEYLVYDNWLNKEKRYPLWGIELDTAKDIVSFSNQVGEEIVITFPTKYFRDRMVLNEPYCNQEKLYDIEIYDDYREPER